MRSGDSFECTLTFPFDLTGYLLKSQIRDFVGSPAVLQNFTITPVPDTNNKITLSLTSSQTETLPQISYWDIRLQSTTDAQYEKTYMKGKVFTETTISEFNPDPYSYGWRG